MEGTARGRSTTGSKKRTVCKRLLAGIRLGCDDAGMQTFNAAHKHVQQASTLRLWTMGLLVLWFPYVFVWFVNKPMYPKAFRIAVTGWAIVWCACAVLYLAVGGDRVPYVR